jgi:ribonuclease R
VMRETAAWVDGYTPKGHGKAALVQLILRAQKRAVYQTLNIGHFGLASPAYCHFTSPIRRYPDLLVHRGLLAELGVADQPTTSTLGDWAEHCSVMEREASKIELKADDIALTHLLKRRLDGSGWRETVFDGQIMSLTRRGMFILFDRLFEGYLSVRELTDDYYELNELETALVGKRTGEAYRLADIVPVRVLAVDEARGRIDLGLAEEDWRSTRGGSEEERGSRLPETVGAASRAMPSGPRSRSTKTGHRKTGPSTGSSGRPTRGRSVRPRSTKVGGRAGGR